MRGGQFIIGVNDPSSTTGEFPARTTEVKPYVIDKYPVTVEDFKWVVSSVYNIYIYIYFHIIITDKAAIKTRVTLYTLFYRAFKRDKFKYKTEPETKGYSWVFFQRVSPHSIRDTKVAHHSSEPWWMAVRGATWERVSSLIALFESLKKYRYV